MTNLPFSTYDTISGIIARLPQAEQVLQSFNIDTQSGGERPLFRALREHAQSEFEVMDALEQEWRRKHN
jgi:iron-sulfur cluster repair protein YtfE (RIC family)